jgi:hypothetical protein
VTSSLQNDCSQVAIDTTPVSHSSGGLRFNGRCWASVCVSVFPAVIRLCVLYLHLRRLNVWTLGFQDHGSLYRKSGFQATKILQRSVLYYRYAADSWRSLNAKSLDTKSYSYNRTSGNEIPFGFYSNLTVRGPNIWTLWETGCRYRAVRVLMWFSCHLGCHGLAVQGYALFKLKHCWCVIEEPNRILVKSNRMHSHTARSQQAPFKCHSERGRRWARYSRRVTV